METPTNLSFWIDRVSFTIVTLALLAVTVHTTLSSVYAAPAVRWVTEVAQQLATSFLR